jgi:hypothetical protein
MLEFVRGKASASERKLRLFAVACVRRRWSFLTEIRSREAVEAAERFADGVIGRREVERAAARAVNPAGTSTHSARLAEQVARVRLSRVLGVAAYDINTRVSVALLRDVFGNPFRSAPVIDPAWLSWQGGTAPQLARGAYDDRRLPEGTLDPARLAVLADALEDAGCTDAELLGHLRGPGPHVRGCWAVDVVLGRE